MSATVGIFGTGSTAARHVAAWRALGVDVVAYSRSAQRRAAFAAEHDVSVVDDRDAVIEAGVVDLCTPTDTHAELGLAAARGGAHVICEKPLTRTVDEASELVTACARAGVQLLPAHLVRYYPENEAVWRAAESQALGPVRTLRLSRTGELPSWSDWFADVSRSGGVLLDLGVHDIDFARWVAGEVTSVTASTHGENGHPPHRSTVRLTHEGGAKTQLTVAWEVPGTPYRTTFDVEYESASARLDSAGDPLFAWDAAPELRAALPPVPSLPPSGDPMETQLGELLAAIRGRGPARVTAVDGVRAVTIALAATRSARTGEPVAVGPERS